MDGLTIAFGLLYVLKLSVELRTVNALFVDRVVVSDSIGSSSSSDGTLDRVGIILNEIFNFSSVSLDLIKHPTGNEVSNGKLFFFVKLEHVDLISRIEGHVYALCLTTLRSFILLLI